MTTTPNFYSEIDLRGNREKVALQPGSYGTSKQPGLKIVAYIDKASKLDKSGAMRHSFLVAATRPSREQMQAGENGKAAAAGEGFETPDFEGTAFMSLTLHELWKAPESVALAFTEASRNKDGVIQKDLEQAAIASGAATTESLHNARLHYQKIATDKILAANTPEEDQTEAVKTQYRKELMSVSIKIGQFFTLQDWKNGGDKSKRDINLNPLELVGTEFSGKVESGLNGQSELTSVYSRG